jgi:membrane-associated phospholipid phosphatase
MKALSHEWPARSLEKDLYPPRPDASSLRSPRGGLRARGAFSIRTRATASGGVASDYVLGGLGLLLIGDWILLRDDYPITERFRLDTRWFLANTLMTSVAKLSAGRERPLVERCTRDPYYALDCGDQLARNSSFYSGHASTAATLAGLVCARPPSKTATARRRRLHAFSCGGAVAGALATGVLRIVAEEHFATDVIAGWFSGALFGFYLPRRLDQSDHPDASALLRAVTPIVGPKMLGLQYRVEF